MSSKSLSHSEEKCYFQRLQYFISNDVRLFKTLFLLNSQIVQRGNHQSFFWSQIHQLQSLKYSWNLIFRIKWNLYKMWIEPQLQNLDMM